MRKTVVLVGTFDTKGTEYKYVKDLFEELGLHVLTINIGVYSSLFEGDITTDEDQALFDTLRRGIDRDKIRLVELDCHINDKEFGITAAKLLLQLIDEAENK